MNSEQKKAFLKIFLTEAENLLGELEQGFLFLEDHPKDEETIGNLFRSAHTLKGSAATLGFDGASDLVHSMEDVLELLRGRVLTVDSGLISIFLSCVDEVRELIKKGKKGNHTPGTTYQKLSQQLKKYKQKGRRKKKRREKEKINADRVDSSGEEQKFLEKETGFLDTQDKTLRVGVDKLNQMMISAGEIAIAYARLKNFLKEEGENPEITEAKETVDRFFFDLQEQIMKARMVPVAPTFHSCARTVRDVSQRLKKQVELEWEGEEVQVDMMVMEYLRDPLTHMVRNAVDHGIEIPSIREKSGKNVTGKVLLRAFHETGSIVIQVEDDGAGLSREKIYARAVSNGLIKPGEQLSDEEVFQLVFEPGFSTAEKVTSISGRGVGMDVVRQNINKLSGNVYIENIGEGLGSCFSIRLPLTLAIMEGFSVGVGEDSYVLPLNAIIECIEMPSERKNEDGSKGVLNRLGEILPYFYLKDYFGFKHNKGDVQQQKRKRENIVIVSNGHQKVGIVVDELFGENQAVIKPLGKLFEGRKGFAGSTIMGDGRVALILDIPSILEDVNPSVSQITV